MDKKLGVYVCTGCDIGGSLDIDALEKVATSEGKAAVCRRHAMFCGEEGAASIRADVENEGVNTVLVAACSPREQAAAFSFNPTAVSLERVNLRELVVWSHPPNDEDTQMLAEDYLRMGLAKANKMQPLEPFNDTFDKTILVVGGGLTGITAALEAAKAGSDVVLVEKEPRLGGWAAKQWKRVPTEPPYEELEANDLPARIAEVEGHERIRVLTGATVRKTAGAPGLFEVTVDRGGSSETFRAGAIVQATGAVPYDAAKLGHLGYGRHLNVITSATLEEMAVSGRIERPADGGRPQSIAFIQCAGSRDPQHLPYCSADCCATSLRQARYVRQALPDTSVYIIYRDIRTPGQQELFYKKSQDDEGIFLTRGDVVGVADGGGPNVLIDVDNTPLGEKVRLKADLVVLAVGMVPSAGIGPLAREPKKAEEDKEGSREEPPADVILRSNILNLDYRQGPEMPALRDGFPDSHYICFPYETRRTGVYAAGCVRAPMDLVESLDDAAGAALKAIQCVELTSQGKAVHPRVGDMSYPDLYMARCTQCKRCTEECPFGMYNEDEKFNPLPNPTRCRRCAICMGSCPERIISFKDYSVDIVGSMVKSIEVPEQDEDKPRVVAFLCENDAYPAADLVGRKRVRYNPYVRIIPLRCLGNINLVWIADALSKGIDGVLLIGCKYGDDYQCHFVKGSELANYRMGKIQETLQRLVLEPDRIRVHQLSLDEFDTLPGIFDDFLEKIREVGPNPYKGF